MSNRLKQESSPYLLQHSEHPVVWYPWCEEAFEKARIHDKPVFFKHWVQYLPLVPCHGTRKL